IAEPIWLTAASMKLLPSANGIAVEESNTYTFADHSSLKRNDALKLDGRGRSAFKSAGNSESGGSTFTLFPLTLHPPRHIIPPPAKPRPARHDDPSSTAILRLRRTHAAATRSSRERPWSVPVPTGYFFRYPIPGRSQSGVVFPCRTNTPAARRPQ